MADQTLRIGIQVDDNGAEQKLLGVAVAEEKVSTAATQKLDPALDGLQKQLGETKTAADKLETSSKKLADTKAATAKSTDMLTSSIMKFVSAAAIGAAIKQTIEFAGKIQDMSDKTKLSTGFLQQLSGASEQSGVSLEAMSRAALNLTKNIGNGNDALGGAVAALGLSFSDLKAMKPEEQFVTLAKAVAGVKDPVEQTRLGFAVFGRDWQAIAAAVTRETLEMANATIIMRDSTVKALDTLGDAWTQLKRRFVVEVGEMLATGKGLAILGGPLVQGGVNGWNALQLVMNGAGAVPGLPTGPTGAINPGATSVGPVGNDALTSFIETKLNRIKDETDKFDKGVQAEAKKAQDAWSKWAQSISNPWANLATFSTTNATFPTLPNISGSNVSGLPGNLGSSNPWAGAGPIGAPGVTSRPVGGASSSAFQNVLGGLPAAILGAFQGGGNVGASIGSSLGGSIGGELVGSIGKTITGTLGTTLGGAINAIIPGLGSLLGGLAGKLFGKLFGPSQEQLTQKMRDQWIASVKDMEALERAADLAGISLEALYDAKKVKEFEKAQRDLNAEMAQYEKVLKGLDTAADGLNLRVTAFGKSIGDATVLTDEQKKSFEALGNISFTTFAMTLQYTGDLIGSLNAIGPALDTLIGLQGRFGLESNAAIQNLFDLRAILQKLPDVADGIQGLTQIMKGLGDAGLVNRQTFEDFGKDAVGLFNDMIAKGVPTEKALMLLQPVLQQLYELQGKFGASTDDATQNLIDMASQSGLVGESFRSAADQMVEIMTGVRDILVDIKDALDKIGGTTLDPITIPINYESNGPGPYGEGSEGSPYAALGGYVTASGVQYFARGGRVGGPRGSDTVPAWLTPGEYVVDRGSVARAGGPAGVRRALSGGGITINVSGYFDSPRAQRAFIENVKRGLSNDQRMQGRQSVA